MKDETKAKIRAWWDKGLSFLISVKKKYDDSKPDVRSVWDVNTCHVLPGDRDLFERNSPGIVHGDATGALVYVKPCHETGDVSDLIADMTAVGWSYSVVDIIMKAEKAGIELIHFHVDAPEVRGWPKFCPDNL